MAANVKKAANDEVAGKGHNSKDNPEYVKERIQEASKELDAIDIKKRVLNDEAKGIRRQLKKDTDVTAKRLNAMRELTGIEDDDERRAAISEIRICFEALSTGEQGDLFKSEDDKEDA